MIIGGLFRTQRNRQFTYEPRFYDESKERREELRKTIEEKELAQKEGRYVPNIRGKISRRRTGHSASSKPRSSGSLVMLLIKLALVGGIIFMVFKFLDRIYA
jgi:hypothetical protein